MPLQIFIEDRLNDAYEVLARKARGLSLERNNRREVRASIIHLDELTSWEGLLELVKASQEAGYTCVMFIIDEEALPFSADRPDKLDAFKQAFTYLCSRLQQLPGRDALKHMNIIRIVCKRCLESWLVSDPQAIVDAVRGGRGVNYVPVQRNTENMTPREAADQIAHVIREVGRRIGKIDLRRVSGSNVKHRGKTIAQYVDLDRARLYNRSLAYFFDMVDCRLHGCECLCPE